MAPVALPGHMPNTAKLGTASIPSPLPVADTSPPGRKRTLTSTEGRHCLLEKGPNLLIVSRSRTFLLEVKY